MVERKRPDGTQGWDMSQERKFMENLLSQRFNFFLVTFALVVTGAVNCRLQIHLRLVLTIGAFLALGLVAVLWRSQEKLDLILTKLISDESHPVSIIDKLAIGKSRRALIGRVIPAFCCIVLFLGAVLAWFDVLRAQAP